MTEHVVPEGFYERPLPPTPDGIGCRTRWKQRDCGHLIAVGREVPAECDACIDAREAVALSALAYVADRLSA